MRYRLLLMSLLILLVFNSAVVLRVNTASAPVIKVEPKDIVVAPGETFTVNITISDVIPENSVNGIYGWEIDMSFNSSIIEAVSVKEGTFLSGAGSTWWTPPRIDNATGLVVAIDLLFPYPEIGAFGSGVLANVTFKAMAEGKTSLHFLSEAPYTTKLRTYNGTAILPIEYTAVDGAFEYPLFRDVAVNGVTVSPTEVVGGQLVSINVTVENRGKVSESFGVAVSYDSTAIETKQVTDLASNSSQLVSFSWNTKDVSAGNYTITATASAVSGEANSTNNTFHDGVVKVTAPSPAFPIEFLIIGVVIVAAVASGLSFLYLRKRK